MLKNSNRFFLGEGGRGGRSVILHKFSGINISPNFHVPANTTLGREREEEEDIFTATTNMVRALKMQLYYECSTESRAHLCHISHEVETVSVG